MRSPSHFSRPSPSSVFRSVLGGVLVLGLASAASAQIVIDPAPLPCLAQAQPIPSGVTARPADDYLTWPDHNYLHSGTNLQGAPAYEKFAAGLFWLPPAPAELAAFQSVVVVTNPNPGAVATVTVDFFDQVGNPVGSSFFVLAAEASRVVIAQPLLTGPSATPGLGSARVTSTGAPIVGETVHHANSVDLSGFSGGSVLLDPENFNLGLNSLQQLQMAQTGKKTLWYGPMPFSTTVPLEFLNGNAPMLQIENPNPTPTTITLVYSSRLGVIVPAITVTLPAFGSHLDLTLWNSFMTSYLSGAASDDDFRVVVAGTQPIIGDALMLDLFGGIGSLSAGKRFRMGSAMMANTPAASLVNAELTVETASPGVDTMVGLFNPTPTNIGPVRINYFDRNGALLAADNIASFPRGALARIGPGLPSSPNYPAAPVFAGWMRISACKVGLVGWTMRQGGEHATTGGAPKKTWGEELTGANGLEPGPGFAVTVAGQSFVRKVSPLVRTDRSFYWPGYTTWVNDGAANAGPYWFRFFDQPGTNRTNVAGQPFAGLRFGATSFTYEDPLVSFFGPINLSGRVDTTNGGFDGIHVIGDPLVEWGIFDGGDD